MGVAPPEAGAVSQKKMTYEGWVGHCAISW